MFLEDRIGDVGGDRSSMGILAGVKYHRDVSKNNNNR